MRPRRQGIHSKNLSTSSTPIKRVQLSNRWRFTSIVSQSLKYSRKSHLNVVQTSTVHFNQMFQSKYKISDNILQSLYWKGFLFITVFLQQICSCVDFRRYTESFKRLYMNKSHGLKSSDYSDR